MKLRTKISGLLVAVYFITNWSVEDKLKGHELLVTKELAENLFVEIYTKSYGVNGGSSIIYLLTDHDDLQKIIGNCDDKESLDVSIEGDRVVARKYTRRNLRHRAKKLIYTRCVYRIRY
ncbi:MAG: hypothetical protein AAF433_06565 [Bacteroidota bacterium]